MALKNKNILIVGAGIAGPTLAYWLKEYGFRPTVIERASEPRRVAGFHFTKNSVITTILNIFQYLLRKISHTINTALKSNTRSKGGIK